MSRVTVLSWTPDEIATLERMARAGRSNAAIAAALKKRTPQAVSSKRHVLGLPSEHATRFSRQVAAAIPRDEKLSAMGRAGGLRTAALRAEEAKAERRKPWNPATDARPAWLRKRRTVTA
jgi:hypothetical protein